LSRKEFFNNAADTWDDRVCTPSLSIFLEKLVPQFGLEAGQKVLDVGTGTGILIPYLSREVGPSGLVTAIDFSENMLQVCKTKHTHLKNVTVKIGDIEKEAAFPPETFDAVVCFGVFPHLENKKNALQNINYMLKPAGTLIIAHALSSKELKTHHKNASAPVCHDMLPEMPEMKQLLEQTGFTEISIKDEPGFYLCTAHKSWKP
jgi:demethylmenaquinone methyltransferase/2-methoxy-6-polyprenyl-1,4-benzoquinol methylase